MALWNRANSKLYFASKFSKGSWGVSCVALFIKQKEIFLLGQNLSIFSRKSATKSSFKWTEFATRGSPDRERSFISKEFCHKLRISLIPPPISLIPPPQYLVVDTKFSLLKRDLNWQGFRDFQGWNHLKDLQKRFGTSLDQFGGGFPRNNRQIFSQERNRFPKPGHSLETIWYGFLAKDSSNVGENLVIKR